eukprot:PhF_6_TR42162/c0_g1_i3/m.63726
MDLSSSVRCCVICGLFSTADIRTMFQSTTEGRTSTRQSQRPSATAISSLACQCSHKGNGGGSFLLMTHHTRSKIRFDYIFENYKPMSRTGDWDEVKRRELVIQVNVCEVCSGEKEVVAALATSSSGSSTTTGACFCGENKYDMVDALNCLMMLREYRKGLGVGFTKEDEEVLQMRQKHTWGSQGISPIAWDLARLWKAYFHVVVDKSNIVGHFFKLCKQLEFYDIHLGVYSPSEPQSLEHLHLLYSFVIPYFFYFDDTIDTPHSPWLQSSLKYVGFPLLVLYCLHQTSCVNKVISQDTQIPISPYIVTILNMCVARWLRHAQEEKVWGDLVGLVVRMNQLGMFRVVAEVTLAYSVEIKKAHIALGVPL